MNVCEFTAALCILVGLTSGYAYGHLVLVNEYPVKQLTPAEPQEVDDFVHTLRRYAQDTLGSGEAVQENNVLSKNSTIPCVNGTNHQNHRNESIIHPARSGKYPGEDGGDTLGFGSVLHDTLHSILKTFGDNSSRPTLFKTNFALIENRDINY